MSQGHVSRSRVKVTCQGHVGYLGLVEGYFFFIFHARSLSDRALTPHPYHNYTLVVSQQGGGGGVWVR